MTFLQENQNHYFVKQVNEMKQQCSILKKYEHKMEQVIILEDELEEDIDLPGWTPEFVDEISSAYDDDVYKIERMTGVNFIAT